MPRRAADSVARITHHASRITRQRELARTLTTDHTASARGCRQWLPRREVINDLAVPS
jgi:hypothetical protein